MAVPSTSQGIWHSLYYLYMAIALLIGGLVLAWLAYILIKYRAKPGQARPRDAPKAGVLPSERGHPIWSYVMALVIAGIMFGLAFGTISAVQTLEEPPADRELVMVNVTGFQFGWRLTQYGEGGVPIPRVTDWTVPVNMPIVADVQSTDVWHNFALPDFRIRIDVVPGQINHIWWEAHDTGEIYPVCVQLCGVGHAIMKTNMFIVTEDEWRTYIAAESAKEYQKLERNGRVANATYDGNELTLVSGATYDAAKPLALNITNAGSAPATIRGTFGQTSIAPGSTGYVFLNPGDTPRFGSVS